VGNYSKLAACYQNCHGSAALSGCAHFDGVWLYSVNCLLINADFFMSLSCYPRLLCVVALLSPLWYMATANAQTYIAAFADSQWKTQSSSFACSLEHEIPGFGKVRLVRKGGGAEVLELKGKTQSFTMGSVLVEAVPPAWRSDLESNNLGQVQAGQGPLSINGKPIAAIIGSLEQGTNVIFSGSNLRVGLEARNFAPALATYKRCIGELIPYTFEQLSRTVLHYNREADDLNATTKTQLDKIVRYMKADKNVLGIIVDAHSDKHPKPEDSLALSQRQAEWVTAYLVDKGVPADNITMRWHGDKFPIANNQNKAGQAKNRRVTVRLENETTRKEMEKKIAVIKEAEQKAVAEKTAKNTADKEASDKEASAISTQELEHLTETQDLTTGQQPRSQSVQ
jgi:outer membrane protein OmpA-like peptidoglycan-associated protein